MLNGITRLKLSQSSEMKAYLVRSCIDLRRSFMFRYDPSTPFRSMHRLGGHEDERSKGKEGRGERRPL